MAKLRTTKNQIHPQRLQFGGLNLPFLNKYQDLNNQWGNFWRGNDYFGATGMLNNTINSNQSALNSFQDTQNYNKRIGASVWGDTALMYSYRNDWNRRNPNATADEKARFDNYNDFYYKYEGKAAPEWDGTSTLEAGAPGSSVSDYNAWKKGRESVADQAKKEWSANNSTYNTMNAESRKQMGQAMTNSASGIFSGLNYMNAYTPPEEINLQQGSKGIMYQDGGYVKGPGMKMSPMMADFGAIQPQNSSWAHFPSGNHAIDAIDSLLFSGRSKYYTPKTKVAEALSKYSGGDYSNHKYAKKTLGSLNANEKTELLNDIIKKEVTADNYNTNYAGVLAGRQISPSVVDYQVTSRQKGGKVNLTGFTPGTPSMNNSMNEIPSGDITMEQTPIPLLAIGKGGADNGLLKVLQPNSKGYNFKSKSTVEIPLEQQQKEQQQIPPEVMIAQQSQNIEQQEAMAQYGKYINYNPLHAQFGIDVSEDQWISQILDYETNNGSAGGTGLTNYGIKKDKWAPKYSYLNKNTINKKDAIKFIKEEYLSKVKNYPPEIQKRLVDYAYNSGRSIEDLLLFADGKISLDDINSSNVYTDKWKDNKSEIEKNLKNPEFVSKLNNARDQVAKTTKQINGQANPAYENTWYDRVRMFDPVKTSYNENNKISNINANTTSSNMSSIDDRYNESIGYNQQVVQPAVQQSLQQQVSQPISQNKSSANSNAFGITSGLQQVFQNMADKTSNNLGYIVPVPVPGTDKPATPEDRAAFMQKFTPNTNPYGNMSEQQAAYLNGISGGDYINATSDFNQRMLQGYNQAQAQPRGVNIPMLPTINPTVVEPMAGLGFNRDKMAVEMSVSNNVRLKKGGTQKVANYQQMLKAAGYNIEVDGAWGPKTQAAYEAYTGKKAPSKTAIATGKAKVASNTIKNNNYGYNSEVAAYLKSNNIEPNSENIQAFYNNTAQLTTSNNLPQVANNTAQSNLFTGNFSMPSFNDILPSFTPWGSDTIYRPEDYLPTVKHSSNIIPTKEQVAKYNKPRKKWNEKNPKLFGSDVHPSLARTLNRLGLYRYGGSVSKFQFGGSINDEHSIPIFSSNLEDFGLTELQTEKDEVAFMPDGSIVDVKAKELHKKQDKHNVSDIMQSGTYVFSNDPKMKFSIKSKIGGVELGDMKLGKSVFKYKENEITPGPEDIMLKTMFFNNNKKELTTADIAKNVKKNLPIIDLKNDYFADRAIAENKDQRLEYLSILKAFNEFKKPKSRSIPKAQYGMPIQPTQNGLDGVMGYGDKQMDPFKRMDNNIVSMWNMPQPKLPTIPRMYENGGTIPQAQFGWLADGIDAIGGWSRRAKRDQERKNAILAREAQGYRDELQRGVNTAGGIGVGTNLATYAAALNVPLQKYDDQSEQMSLYNAAANRAAQRLEASKYTASQGIGGASSLARYSNPTNYGDYLSKVQSQSDGNISKLNQAIANLDMQRANANVGFISNRNAGRNQSLNARDTQLYNANIQGIGNVGRSAQEATFNTADTKYRLGNEKMAYDAYLTDKAEAAKQAKQQQIRGYTNEIGQLGLTYATGGFGGSKLFDKGNSSQAGQPSFTGFNPASFSGPNFQNPAQMSPIEQRFNSNYNGGFAQYNTINPGGLVNRSGGMLSFDPITGTWRY